MGNAWFRVGSRYLLIFQDEQPAAGPARLPGQGPGLVHVLGALFILASGITLLQVAANPYVTVLGPPQTASARLNLTQAFNSLGTALAPFAGSLPHPGRGRQAGRGVAAHGRRALPEEVAARG
jgi:hypothetical protein